MKAALKTAASGDTIYLESGTYSGLSIQNVAIAGNVTITSKDPGDPAVLTGLNMKASSGLTFANLEFAPPEGGHFAYLVTGSKNITFTGLDVHGSMNDNPGNDSSGIAIRSSENIRIENSEFQQLVRGVTVSGSKGVVVEGNKFHDLRHDGMTVSDTSDIQILNNHLSDFYPQTGDHPDAIQFLTTNTTKASENIVISGNVILRGDGSAMQGIFLKDEVGSLPYKNVVISENLLIGTGYNGIMVLHGEDLKITGNEVVSYEGKTNLSWIRLENTDGVVLQDNEAAHYSFGVVKGLTQIDNITTKAVADGGKAALEAWSPSLGGADKPSQPSATPMVVNGDAGNNSLVGGAGNDTLSDGYGSDTMIGGAGDDTYFISNPGKTEADTIVEKAGAGVDTVVSSASYVLTDNVEVLKLTGKGGLTGRGNELDNTIVGNDGANIIDGLGGNDTLDGGLGIDTVIGGVGNDVLTGGGGNDTFWFKPGGGKDTITDFRANGDADKLDLSNYLKVGLKPVFTDVGNDIVVSFGNGDQITLVGVHADNLTTFAKDVIV